MRKRVKYSTYKNYYSTYKKIPGSYNRADKTIELEFPDLPKVKIIDENEEKGAENIKDVIEYLKQHEKTNSYGERYFDFTKIDFIKFCKMGKGHTLREGWNKIDSEYGSYKFTDTESYEEALNFAEFGWDYGIKELNERVKIYSHKSTFKSEYNVVGGQASVPRYLQGIPTNMVLQKRVPQKEKIITLTKEISYSSYFKSDTILNENAKFIKIIQNLESQGYRVNVNIISTVLENVNNYSKYTVTKVRIKNASERLNIGKLAFMIAHPSTFRRFIFKILELNEESKNYRAYGYPAFLDKEKGIKLTSRFLDKNEYLINQMVGDPEKFELKK